VFVSTISVLPRRDLKRHLERNVVSRDLDKVLEAELASTFAFWPVSKNTTPLPDDLGLDVVIARHQLGGSIGLSSSTILFFWWWRPKIEIRSRLFNLETSRNVGTFSVVERLGWKAAIARLVNFHGFDEKDLLYLLATGSQKLMHKMKARVSV